MTARILQELTTDTPLQHLTWPILEEVYPRDLVCQILHDLGRWEQRERTRNPVLMVSLLIAWTMALKQVWMQLTSMLRWLSRRPRRAWRARRRCAIDAGRWEEDPCAC